MASAVQPSRFLDAAILGLFAMLISALSLYMFGEFWTLAQDSRFSSYKVGFVLQKLFPFKRTFDINLTHILLFTIAVLLLSVRPEYPPQVESAAAQKRERAPSKVQEEAAAAAAKKSGKN